MEEDSDVVRDHNQIIHGQFNKNKDYKYYIEINVMKIKKVTYRDDISSK